MLHSPPTRQKNIDGSWKSRYLGATLGRQNVIRSPERDQVLKWLGGIPTARTGLRRGGVSPIAVASRIRELTSPPRFRRNDPAAIFLFERRRPETITRHIEIAIARELFLLLGVFLPRLGPPNSGGPFFVSGAVRHQATSPCRSRFRWDRRADPPEGRAGDLDDRRRLRTSGYARPGTRPRRCNGCWRTAR